MVDIKLIETEEEYNEALERLDLLFDAPVGSQEAKEAEVLALLINQYEEAHYPIDEPSPEEYARIRMEESGPGNPL
jgi:HTH-type transcriptional regulator/antitoxin HigA